MRTRLTIDGMSCQHCVQAVYTALTPVEGITKLEIGVGWAEVEHDGRATIEALSDAIAVAGYRARADAPPRRGRSLPLF